MSDRDKHIEWRGSALEDLTAFPDDARRVAGHQLRLVQKGLSPDDWRPMPSVGEGVAEIRVNVGDAYRVFYVAKFSEAIYVFHAFQKRTRKTSEHDIELGRKRYREIVAERQQAKTDDPSVRGTKP